MATTPTPIQDPAQPILAGDPQLNDETRANLWDAFNKSKDANELTQALQPLVVPDDTKKRLVLAKQQAGSVATPAANPVQTAVTTMAAMPQDQLDLAESHPQLLKALVESLKPAEKTEEPEPPPLTPRADGQPHFPKIPDKHYRVAASDGGIWDVPHDNIEIARRRDPLLHILNP